MSNTEPLMPGLGFGRLVWGKSPKQWATYPQSLRVAASGHPSFLFLFFESLNFFKDLFITFEKAFDVFSPLARLF